MAATRIRVVSRAGWFDSGIGVEAATVAVADQGTCWVEHDGATVRLRRTGLRALVAGVAAGLVFASTGSVVFLWAVTARLSWLEVGLSVVGIVVCGLGLIGAWAPLSAWVEARRFPLSMC